MIFRRFLGLGAILALAWLCWGVPKALAAPEEPVGFPPMAMGAAAQQIPAGAKFKIRFITPLDSRTTPSGQAFLAEVSDDLWMNRRLILPQGTPVRGRLDMVQKPGFFSKGGMMRLSFDHVQMPSGEIKPLNLQVDAASAKMNMQRNALYTDPGVGKKLNASVDKGVSKYQTFYQKGVEAGRAKGGGANMLLTVPTNAAAGMVVGGAVTTYEAGKAVFGKGEAVTIAPGDELLLDLSRSATMQAQ